MSDLLEELEALHKFLAGEGWEEDAETVEQAVQEIRRLREEVEEMQEREKFLESRCPLDRHPKQHGFSQHEAYFWYGQAGKLQQQLTEAREALEKIREEADSHTVSKPELRTVRSPGFSGIWAIANQALSGGECGERNNASPTSQVCIDRREVDIHAYHQPPKKDPQQRQEGVCPECERCEYAQLDYDEVIDCNHPEHTDDDLRQVDKMVMEEYTPEEKVEQMRKAVGQEEIMRVSMVIPNQCREATTIYMIKRERDRFRNALTAISRQPKPPNVALADVENLITWLVEQAEEALNPPEPCQAKTPRIKLKEG